MAGRWEVVGITTLAAKIRSTDELTSGEKWNVKNIGKNIDQMRRDIPSTMKMKMKIEEVCGKVSEDEERGSFTEVLQSSLLSLFLMHNIGIQLSLTFSSLMAFFDQKPDCEYKIGYLIAWILGESGCIMLTLCLSFASWVCGKTSSSLVALVLVAMWFGSNLTRFVPLPQGALLTLLYMSIKLQVGLK